MSTYDEFTNEPTVEIPLWRYSCMRDAQTKLDILETLFRREEFHITDSLVKAILGIDEEAI
jgi:hypothetical protein